MEFEFVQHKHISPKQLSEIIAVKGSVWNYPTESHKAWIAENILPDDYHLIVRKDNRPVAYLNLVELSLKSNSDIMPAWGIGNVCVTPESQGKNCGLLLMKLTDFFLAQTKRIGVLICKDRVCAFYKRCNWHEHKGIVFIPDGTRLSYNFFTSQPFIGWENVDTIQINRIF